MIDSKIFNIGKTDYSNPEVNSLFLGTDLGLLDSVNRPFPAIFELYKRLKAADWDELEFDFKSCNLEFKTHPKSISETMILTLGWQWEADTVAARSVSAITAPFITSHELDLYTTELAKNEKLHALTYSEIIKNSFDNPDEVIRKVLSEKESINRLTTITSVIHDTYVCGHKLALGLVEKNQETYNKIFLFYVAMFVLERIQFMASFAVTFAIADSGMYVPIGDAVQKICQDELEIHVSADIEILNTELKNSFGLTAFNTNKTLIRKIIDECVEIEKRWTNYLFSQGRGVAGLSPKNVIDEVLLNAKPVYEFFGFIPPSDTPKKSSLAYMKNWVDISKIQKAPQEQKNGQYMLGAISYDVTEHTVFDIEV